MKLEKIAALTLKDLIRKIIPRILDLSSVPEGEPIFQLDVDENKDFYDRIILNSVLVKPSLDRMNEELNEIKAELTAEENARLAEKARVKEIKDSFRAIPDIRGAFQKAGLNIPNPKMELKRIIAENDQTRLALLEAKGAEFDVEESTKKTKRNGKKKQLKDFKKKESSEVTLEELVDIVKGLV